MASSALCLVPIDLGTRHPRRRGGDFPGRGCRDHNVLLLLGRSHPRKPALNSQVVVVGGGGREGGGEEGKSSEKAVLTVAWYASEFLGIIVSLFRTAPSPLSSAPVAPPEKKDVGLEMAASSILDGSRPIGRAQVVEAIKEDFQRSYFVTGNMTLTAYEDDCEFADPAGSFRGLRRFKRNCSNFGTLLLKTDMKLTKWEDFEDKGIGHWRFRSIMSFPWRPILSATGYTEYFYDSQSGRVCRHVEHWNVPKMALLKQIFKPTHWVWGRS